MKKITLILSAVLIVLSSACKENDDTVTSGNITINFSHNWDGVNISNSDFNEIKFMNAKGDNMSIERLRYLISDITFHKENGEKVVIEGYQLIDLSKPESMTYVPSVSVPNNEYSNISITFGFDSEDNIDGQYLDLNSASWNVPSMLGGGYHYMQLEGKFTDNTDTDTGFQYHAIKAVDLTGASPVYTETFIEKNLGSVSISGDTTIEIKMNIAEWFNNPNTWDLNTLGSMLMPNYNAQIMINENGQNVFSLGEVSQ